MAHILITGSADGLGRAAAETLLGDGHQVIVHTRSAGRLAAAEPLINRGASAVIGDLADLDQSRALANQVNRLGPLDAVTTTPASRGARTSCRSTSSRPTCSPSSSSARSDSCNSAVTCTRADEPTSTTWTGADNASPPPTPTASCLTVVAMAMPRLRPDV